jgi:hypothetical protein
MPRSRFITIVLLAPLLGGAALLASACSMARAPEEQVLTNFFRASRVRDNTTLANIAAVSFDPRTDGTVQDFEVVQIGEEQRRSLQIRQLMEEEEKARQDDAAFAKKKKEYQDANLETIEKVVKAERSGQTNFRGKDAEVYTAWSKWRDEQSQYQKRLSEARAKLANERAMAVSSLTAPGRPDIDVGNMDVELITKQVTVNAEVQGPNGGPVTPKTLVFTMQKAVGKSAEGEDMEGRWIITGIRDQAAPAPSTE